MNDILMILRYKNLPIILAVCNTVICFVSAYIYIIINLSVLHNNIYDNMVLLKIHFKVKIMMMMMVIMMMMI